MKHKNSKARFLHNHPGAEYDRYIDPQHVIVDIEDWKKAKRFPQMHQTLKEVRSDINIVGEVSHATLEKINSILKELK